MKLCKHAALISAGKCRGFTLIELMTVVATIAILVAIAYPSYQEYVIRANRSLAQQFMLDIANREEQYRLDARAYTATIGAGGLNLTEPAQLSNRYTFSIALVAGPPPGYTITAAVISGGPQESDGDLTLTNDGVKSPADKWKR
jgi:type IV pilus assembly protein PilE